MRSRVLAFVVLLLLGMAFLWLQSSIPLPARPDLLAILSVAVGFRYDLPWACATGFALGLMEDLSSGRIMGIRAGALVAASAFSNFVASFVNPETYYSKSLSALGPLILGDLASFGLFRMKGIPLTGSFLVRYVIPSSIIWGFVAASPMCWLVDGIRSLAEKLTLQDVGKSREVSL